MQVFSRSPGDGEGLQPCHATRDLRRRERGETSRTLRRRNRECDCDRDGRQRLARLCPCRTGVAVEGILTRDDGDARYLRCLSGQARLRGSKRSVRRPRRAGAHVRPVDSCGLGGSLARDRLPDGAEEILLAHSWPAGAGSCAGSEAPQRSGGGECRARALRRLPGGLRFRGRWALWFEGPSPRPKSKPTTI